MKISIDELQAYLADRYSGWATEQSMFMKLVEEIGEVGVTMQKTFLVHVNEKMCQSIEKVIVLLPFLTQDAGIGIATISCDDIALFVQSPMIAFYTSNGVGRADAQFLQFQSIGVGSLGFARTTECVVEALVEKWGVKSLDDNVLPTLQFEHSHLIARIINEHTLPVELMGHFIDELRQ